MWDCERPYPRMSGNIETLAKLTVREDEIDFTYPVPLEAVSRCDG